MDISNFFDRANNEMIFYDVYLKDRLTQKFIPVPILVKNFVDTRTQTPNTGSDTNNYRFSRRFFMFDNVGGIETNNQYINGGNPSVIFIIYFFLIDIKVIMDYISRSFVMLKQFLLKYYYFQDNKDQKIFVPYFNVECSAQRSTAISSTSITFSVIFHFLIYLIS